MREYSNCLHTTPPGTAACWAGPAGLRHDEHPAARDTSPGAHLAALPHGVAQCKQLVLLAGLAAAFLWVPECSRGTSGCCRLSAMKRSWAPRAGGAAAAPASCCCRPVQPLRHQLHQHSSKPPGRAQQQAPPPTPHLFLLLAVLPILLVAALPPPVGPVGPPPVPALVTPACQLRLVVLWRAVALHRVPRAPLVPALALRLVLPQLFLARLWGRGWVGRSTCGWTLASVRLRAGHPAGIAAPHGALSATAGQSACSLKHTATGPFRPAAPRPAATHLLLFLLRLLLAPRGLVLHLIILVLLLRPLVV